jgi:hypothetical protein
MSIASPNIVKLRLFDICIGREDGVVSLGSLEQKKIRGGAELVAVDLKLAP